MFPKSTTLIAAAMAILFAPISLSAAVYEAPSDHTELIDARSAFIPGNDSIQQVETRQAAEVAELATTVIEGAINIFTSIQDGIKQDKEDRSKFTQDLVQRLHNEHPDFNWIVCHTKHDYKWDGKQGTDWAHKHQEFDIKIGGTIGYEIYNARSGKFFRKGDGGYLNWAYIGNVVKTDNNGKDLTFAKP
ncbi:hypothetical protein AB1N83_006360 [Pleurotus pulmonarius]|nr:hypothetical protein EYR38_004979 [Pleurotus pulmonarius]